MSASGFHGKQPPKRTDRPIEDDQAQYVLSRLRPVSRHQRSGRLGRRLSLPSPRHADPRYHGAILRRPIARLRTQLPGKRTRVVFLSWPDAALPRVRRRHALLPGMGVPHRGHVHRRACGGPHDGGRSAARTGVCRVLHALAAPVRRTRRGVGHVRPRRGNRLFRADLFRPVPHSPRCHRAADPACVFCRCSAYAS